MVTGWWPLNDLNQDICGGSTSHRGRTTVIKNDYKKPEVWNQRRFGTSAGLEPAQVWNQRKKVEVRVQLGFESELGAGREELKMRENSSKQKR